MKSEDYFFFCFHQSIQWYLTCCQRGRDHVRRGAVGGGAHLVAARGRRAATAAVVAVLAVIVVVMRKVHVEDVLVVHLV